MAPIQLENMRIKSVFSNITGLHYKGMNKNYSMFPCGLKIICNLGVISATSSLACVKEILFENYKRHQFLPRRYREYGE